MQLKPAGGGGGRFVFDYIRVRQIQKTAGGFIFEDHGLREQAVAEAVAGRISFVQFDNRALGAGCGGCKG
jgi:hypothetical protein